MKQKHRNGRNRQECKEQSTRGKEMKREEEKRRQHRKGGE